MQPDEVRALAQMLPDVIVGAHKGNPDFRVHGRIFATLWTDEDRMVVKLSAALQAALTEAEPDVFEPIEGSWGKRGWTNVDLMAADEEIIRNALLSAWSTVAPPSLVSAFTPL
jgi:hypothetical protein